MLSQRRFSQRAVINQTLNLYANENMALMASTQEPLRNGFAILEPKRSAKEHKEPKEHKVKRNGLTEIENNNNKRKDLSEDGCFSKGSHYPSRNRYEQGPSKDSDSLFHRISELIRHEETGVPTCHSNRSKRLFKRKDRPYTSLSNQNRTSQDGAALGKSQAVLDFTPKDEPQEGPDPSKASTSRALMNYSRVYRNGSGDRFKVRRDKQFMNHFSLISAQRIVLQEKETKQKKELQKVAPVKVRPPLSGHPRRRESMKAPIPKHRYQQVEQQFQLGGWEYFD